MKAATLKHCEYGAATGHGEWVVLFEHNNPDGSPGCMQIKRYKTRTAAERELKEFLSPDPLEMPDDWDEEEYQRGYNEMHEEMS